MTAPRFTLNSISYTWEPAPYVLPSLYAAPLIAGSDIPDGMIMTLRNINGDELIIRGEMHGDCIVFRHMCGYQRTIGAWVPVEVAPPAYVPKRAAVRKRLKTGLSVEVLKAMSWKGVTK